MRCIPFLPIPAAWTPTNAHTSKRVRTNAERGDPTRFGYAKKGFPEAIDIAGIGDDAFYLATLQALSFRVHGLEITVQYGDLTGDASSTSLRTDLVALAKKAAARG